MNAQETPSEKRFEKFIAILIALTAVFTAFTTFLEHLSSSESERYDRLAQEFSIRATTESINGAVRFSYDWQGAYQNWRELDLMGLNADEIGDNERAAQYRSTRDRLVSLSPLLAAPYFDAQSGAIDPYRYEADLYIVDSTALWEEYENKSAVSNSWDQIANAFVLQLTLYAVALSLFGLSTTISSFVRWLFVLLAGLIVVINALWGMLIYFTPIDEIPESAIQQYAEGIGLAYQGRDSDAIAAFDAALVEYPGYANALYNRGFSKLYIGDSAGAAADFEATIANGKADTSVWWNLGWTYYLLGQYDDAVRINALALNEDPTLIGVRSNQGISLLAQGRASNAIAEYDQMLAEAARQVAEARADGEEAPSSLWYYMDAAALDLQSLVEIIEGRQKPWTQGPALEQIAAERNIIRQTAQEQIRRIKEASVALEFFGELPASSSRASASAFSFVQERYDENGEFLEYADSRVNAYGANEIGILFDFEGFEVGQHEVWKVYVNGYEDTALRVISSWSVGESGSAIKFITYAFSNVFVFTPGEYQVDLYIDSRLVQSGTFTVLDP